MNKPASLIKIITVDFYAWIAFLFPVLVWGMYVLLLLFENVSPANSQIPVIYGGVTVVAILVLIWRVFTIRAVFNDGLEAQAVISKVEFYRNRGRIEYTYTHQGQSYTSGNSVIKTKSTKGIKIDERVIVIVDRNHPKRAFIRDLYV
jgi:hypothetical protein